MLQVAQEVICFSHRENLKNRSFHDAYRSTLIPLYRSTSFENDFLLQLHGYCFLQFGLELRV